MPGCTIFVKLCQFDPDDRTYVHAHMDKLGAVPDRCRDGVHVSPLYRDEREDVRFERWEPGAHVTLGRERRRGGVRARRRVRRSGRCVTRAFVAARNRSARPSRATAGPDGARVWIKTGHLKGL